MPFPGGVAPRPTAAPGSALDPDAAPDAAAERAALAADRPFAGRLVLAGLEPLPGWKGGRMGTFFVEADDGRRLKLRVCASPRRARELERWLRRLPDLVPPFVGRDRRYLLFARLEGHRRLRLADLPAAARALGRLYGAVHASRPRTRRGPSRALRSLAVGRKFARELALLRARGVVDAPLAERLERAVREGVRRNGLAIGLELRDFHVGNLMVDARGDLRVVDEEAFREAVRGLGAAKLLAHVPEPAVLADFRAGYAEVCEPALLAPERLRVARVLDSVHSAASKVGRGAGGEKLEGTLAALRRSVEPAAGGEPQGI